MFSFLRTTHHSVRHLLGSAGIFLIFTAMGGFTWLAPPQAFAERGGARPGPGFFEARVDEAREKLQRHPNQPDFAWKFARDAYRLAEYTNERSRQRSIAQEGVAAAQKAVEIEPKNAAAHFYLALNLSHVARTRLIGALRIIPEMEEHLNRSADLDRNFNHGAAMRALGMLYRDAPGWPLSIGSRSKAREYLLKSLEHHPEYPANQLEWIRSLIHWNEHEKAVEHFPELEAVMSEARERFTGDDWAFFWYRWQNQYAEIERQLEPFTGH